MLTRHVHCRWIAAITVFQAAYLGMVYGITWAWIVGAHLTCTCLHVPHFAVSRTKSGHVIRGDLSGPHSFAGAHTSICYAQGAPGSFAQLLLVWHESELDTTIGLCRSFLPSTWIR